MKKVTLLTLLIFILLPVSSLFAADVSLLTNASISIDHGTVTDLSSLTDKNESNRTRFQPNSAVNIDFPEPVKAESLYIRYTGASGAYRIFFYNSLNELIHTSYVNGIDIQSGIVTKVDLSQDVKRIQLANLSASVMDINEFDVLASKPVINDEESLFVINDLAVVTNSGTSITLSWLGIDSTYFKNYKVYQDTNLLGTVTTNSLSVSQLIPGETYQFKVVPVDTFNKEFAGSTVTYNVPLPDTKPPAVPTGLNVVPDRYTALVKWNRPSDPDLAGYYLYLDGNRVNSTPISTESYNLASLNLETDYKVTVASIDATGNLSAQSPEVSFKTLSLQVAPSTPTNLTATPYNTSVTLSWLPSSAAKNYKVFVDGVYKLTTDATSVKISGLENERTYNFSVQAVNDLGDSELSQVVTAKPSNAYVPDVSLGYKLSDVSTGVSAWFSSYWLLLAFCISIPLSFYVANRVKGLFA